MADCLKLQNQLILELPEDQGGSRHRRAGRRGICGGRGAREDEGDGHEGRSSKVGVPDKKIVMGRPSEVFMMLCVLQGI